MDELATNLLATLKKSAAPVETKLSLFNNLKSSIKHQRVPETAQPTTVECIRLAIASQTSSALVTTGLSALGHLIKRLSLQDQMNVVFSHRPPVIPALLERLGDAKESYRAAASQNLCDMWPSKPMEVEKAIRENVMSGSNTRAKEMAMQWVAKMHAEQGLQFRSFVPPMVACLEDADGSVRESAKTNLVELFRNARDSAKADLKKQLIAYNVRKSIASHILSQLQIPVPAELTSSTHAPSNSRSEKQQPDRPVADVASPEIVMPPSAEIDSIEPMYVYTARELEDMFKAMHPSFEEKETEENWKTRDKNVLKLRRLLKGNSPSEFHNTFVQGIKGLVEGILKVVNTLRTTMSMNGCNLVQELARTLGSSLDSIAETLLRGLEKMCASTKHINAENGNTTVDHIYRYLSYNHRLLDHIWAACQDKNVQPRCYAAGWLRTVLKKQIPYKSNFEHTGGVTAADKCIRKGLSDANPKSREAWRTTYWVYARAWPDKGSAILDSLDPKSQGLLQKHPDNPNPQADSTSFTSSVGPSAASNPRLAASTSRTSLRETIAKQKQATLAAQQRMPERPSSAMSAFSPVKEEPPSARRPPTVQSSSAGTGHRVASGQSQGPSRSVVTGSSSSTNQGSLMSAPMRRPRRQEAPRPATADPYANKIPEAETPIRSPELSPPPRTGTKQSSRSATSHVKAKSTTSTMIPGPESPSSSRTTSPRVSPAKSKHKSVPNISGIPTPTTSPKGTRAALSPPNREENLTMVIPSGQLPQTNIPRQRGFDENDRPGSGYSQPGATDEDQFTMVMPPAAMAQRMKSAAQLPAEQTAAEEPNEPLPLNNSGGGLDVEAEDLPESTARVDSTIQEDVRPDVAVQVYEDPPIDNGGLFTSADGKMALEELPLNEQNVPIPADAAAEQHAEAVAHRDERPVSPSKKETMRAAEATPQDRAEVLKSRRLLASGIERIRERKIDAHGFRRLQDIVKGGSQSSDLNFADLLASLLDYLHASSELISPSASKAQSLKTQSLSTVRGVVALHRDDERVKAAYPTALSAVVSARGMFDGSSHVGADLEKTANEIIKNADEGEVEACTDAMLQLVEDGAKAGADDERTVTMALHVLSKLCAANQHGVGGAQRQRMSASAVRFLGDANPDVRRAGTEFCLELYDTFEGGEQGKAEFWRALKGAGENHLNLVAYYLARRGKA